MSTKIRYFINLELGIYLVMTFEYFTDFISSNRINPTAK